MLIFGAPIGCIFKEARWPIFDKRKSLPWETNAAK